MKKGYWVGQVKEIKNAEIWGAIFREVYEYCR